MAEQGRDLCHRRVKKNDHRPITTEKTLLKDLWFQEAEAKRIGIRSDRAVAPDKPAFATNGEVLIGHGYRVDEDIAQRVAEGTEIEEKRNIER